MAVIVINRYHLLKETIHSLTSQLLLLFTGCTRSTQDQEGTQLNISLFFYWLI